MNLKKKLTSVLSLVLALSMLLSSAAMATNLADAEAGSASSSVVEPTEPTEPATSNPTDPEEPTDPADPEDPEEPTVPADPADPTTPTDPADPTEPTTNEPTTDPSPDTMTAAKGWSVIDKDEWSFTYTDLEGNVVTAGDKEQYPSGKLQVLYIPEQECIVDDETVTRTAGFYAFSEGVWKKDYKASQVSFNIVEIDLVEGGLAKQKSEDLQYSKKRMMNFTVTDGESKGELYNGARTEVCKAEKNKKLKRRYDDGLPRKGWGLGTDKNLYYYSDGFFQTAVSKKQLSSDKGYHLFEGKLYYASADTLTKKKTSPYAAPCTDRWTNPKDGVKRRYEKGVPYTGFGLGTQKTPNLYYYVDGLYQKTVDKHGKEIYDGKKSRDELDAFQGDGKVWKGKLYVATKTTLEKDKTSPYAVPFTGYRMENGKMYKYSKGTSVLFTGIYNGDESSLKKYKGYYFEKGVKKTLKDGWQNIGSKRYYIKKGKPLVGWHYVKCNGSTYYYYFDKNGAQVKDLFAHFGKSYMKKKMVVNVNRPNHTVDMLLYNSKTKKYDIPAKSFVTTTPEENAHFKTGSYKLTYRRKWWSFTNPKNKKTSYYQYATRVAGTYGALIHSSRYTAKSVKALAWKTYNNLGANRSYYCIRVQCGNAKLIYDCVGYQGQGKVLCKFSNSKTKGPNGKVTMANSGGLVKPGTKMDPTDPAAKK